jgi:eukaryotic-like serine/threonine-protein kinase
MIIQTGFDEQTVADRGFGDRPVDDNDDDRNYAEALFGGDGEDVDEDAHTKVAPANPWESGPVPQVRQPEATPLPEARGRVLGRYMMYEEIARGGMASVHLGRSLEHAGMARTVAIKRLHSQLAWNPGFVAMFLDEARITAKVKHPNVVAPIDFVVLESQGELCLVMEYVHGETLTHLLSASFKRMDPPPPAVAVSIMAGVLRGLHAAHEAKTDGGAPLGIVHRDVSPQNIMVGADGVARILDFGVATAKVQPSQTADIELKGKPSYLSPEQIRGGAVDRRADVFASGVVLWEMLARRRLFQHSDPRVVLLKILKGDISPPSHHNPEVPAELDAAVLKALQRDPARRFASARDFALAIENAFEPATFPEVGDWVRDVAGDVLARRARRVSDLAAKDARRLGDLPEALPIFDRRWRRWAVVAGLLAVVGVSAVWSGEAAPRAAGALPAATATAATPKAVAAAAAAPRAAAPSKPQPMVRTVAKAMSMAPPAATLPASAPVAMAMAAPPAPAPAPTPAAVAPALAPAPREAPAPAPVSPAAPAAATTTRPAPVAAAPVVAAASPLPAPVAAAAPLVKPAAAVAPVAAAPTVPPAPAEAPRAAAPAPARAVASMPAPARMAAAADAERSATAPPTRSRAVSSASASASDGKMRLVVGAEGKRASGVRAMTELNRRAVSAYENMSFDEARRLLRSALEISAIVRLGDHRLTAQTHAHMALVLVGGYKQRALGVEHFKKALAVNPGVRVAQRLFTPEVSAAFQEASLAGWSSRSAPGA